MRKIAAIVGLILLCVWVAPAPSAARTTIRLSLILGTNSDWYAGAKHWKELVEERTDGRVRVKIFPEAQLAGHNQRTELEMVQSGVIGASLESSILLSLLDQRFSAFSLPWLFPGHDVANTVCDGPVGDRMLRILEEKNLVGLAYGVNGFRQVTNSSHPIQIPDDLKNLKIRVPAIEMYIRIFRMLGADPSSMNFGELFQALQAGTMDGQENPISVIHNAKLYEVQKHVSLWNYSYDPIILCVNKSLWDKLSEVDQAILRQAAKESMDAQRKFSVSQEIELLEKLRALGMEVTELGADEFEPFRVRIAEIYQEYATIIGADLIAEFRQAVTQAQQ